MVDPIISIFRATGQFFLNMLGKLAHGFGDLWESLATPWLLLLVVFASCFLYLVVLSGFGWLKTKAKEGKPEDRSRVVSRRSLRTFAGWATLPWWCVKRLAISAGAATDRPTEAAAGLLAAAALGAAAYAYFLEVMPQRTIDPQVRCVRAETTASIANETGKGKAALERLPMGPGTHRLQIVMPNQAAAYIYGCRFQVWPEFDTPDDPNGAPWAVKSLEGDQPDKSVKEQAFACGQEKDNLDLDLFKALRLSSNEIADQLTRGYKVPWLNLRVMYKRGLSERYVVLTSRPCED